MKERDILAAQTEWLRSEIVLLYAMRDSHRYTKKRVSTGRDWKLSKGDPIGRIVPGARDGQATLWVRPCNFRNYMNEIGGVGKRIIRRFPKMVLQVGPAMQVERCIGVEIK